MIEDAASYIKSIKRTVHINELLIDNSQKCAKQTVIAILITKDGEIFSGQNRCKNPQKVCPRKGMKSGDGYYLCKQICKQENHAEIDVCLKAGDKAKGSSIYLFGHTYSCQNCVDTMVKYGIENWNCFNHSIK